jgi:hypothetical protein
MAVKRIIDTIDESDDEEGKTTYTKSPPVQKTSLKTQINILKSNSKTNFIIE